MRSYIINLQVCALRRAGFSESGRICHGRVSAGDRRRPLSDGPPKRRGRHHRPEHDRRGRPLANFG